MNLKYLLTIAPLLAISLDSANAATAVNFYFGALRDATGTILPDDTLVVLIANTSSSAGSESIPGGLITNLSASGLDTNLAHQHFAGQTLTPGATINLDTIFYVGTINGVAALGPDYAGTVVDNNVDIPYVGGMAVGQSFGLYWFPGLTPDTNTLPSGAFQIGGFFHEDPNLGDIGMTLPSDGLYNVFQVDGPTAAIDGETSEIGVGAFTAIVVPEPSTLVLSALGLAALLRRRRE